VIALLNHSDPSEITLVNPACRLDFVHVTLVIGNSYSAKLTFLAHVDAIAAIRALWRSSLFQDFLYPRLFIFEWALPLPFHDCARGMLLFGNAVVGLCTHDRIPIFG